MIISIRGTHGSGKSTLVRGIMDRLGVVDTHYHEGRNRPVGYSCNNNLFVPGSYQNVTGGCDTIPAIATIFELVKHYAAHGNVLFEGILAQHSAVRLLEVAKDHETQVICLSTPVQECIDSVNGRRLARGVEPLGSTSNIEKEAKAVLSSGRTLAGKGVKVLHLSRQDAYDHVWGLFGTP